MRVAVATKGEGLVNEHFGWVDEFLVYEGGPGDVHFLEARNVKSFCHGPEICKNEHEARIQKVIPMLQDCQALVCEAIGQHPALALLRAGIIPYETQGPIEKAVEDAACGQLQPPDWLLELEKASKASASALAQKQ